MCGDWSAGVLHEQNRAILGISQDFYRFYVCILCTSVHVFVIGVIFLYKNDVEMRLFLCILYKDTVKL